MYRISTVLMPWLKLFNENNSTLLQYFYVTIIRILNSARIFSILVIPPENDLYPFSSANISDFTSCKIYQLKNYLLRKSDKKWPSNESLRIKSWHASEPSCLSRLSDFDILVDSANKTIEKFMLLVFMSFERNYYVILLSKRPLVHLFLPDQSERWKERNVQEFQKSSSFSRT